MNQLFAYPRLRRPDALICLSEMRDLAAKDPTRLVNLSATAHPRAEPVPTGATIASPERIGQVRATVLAGLAGWLTGSPIPRESTVQFDLLLGRLLVQELQILPADAAHEDTWSFLSAVVFPDVVWARYPDLHQDRVLGKRHRNTLRRAWFRYDVVGDLQDSAIQPLGEDEMTGLFERAQVAGNRELVRAAAQNILASRASNRSEYARSLMKRVTALTGPYLLDGLSVDELQREIALLGDRRENGSEVQLLPGPSGSPDSPSVHSPPRHSSAPASEVVRVTQEDRSDVVRRFHKEVVILCREVESVLGRRPQALLRMVGQMGAVEAARAVVGEAHPSDTFVMLWERGRLDLTLENLVRREDFRGLFAEAIIEQASSRLERLGGTVG